MGPRPAALATLLLVLSGCASANNSAFGRFSAPDPVVYPNPPDTARIQFLFTITSSDDLGGGESGGLIDALWGSRSNPAEVNVLNKPYGVTFDGTQIRVCDSMLGGLAVINVPQRLFETFRPRGPGRLQKPINCFNDAAGRLYVVDSGRTDVAVFDAQGTYLGAIKEPGDNPADVFADDDGIWVTDLARQEVRLHDATTFELVRTFPEPDAPANERLYLPTNLWVSGDYVYVSDGGAYSIKIYTRSGEYVRSIGRIGDAPGTFARPKGVAVDRAGRVYVVDSAFQKIQLFDDQGRLLMYFGGGPPGAGATALPAKVSISYDGLELFSDRVAPGYELEYLLFVTNQLGTDRLNVYGFLRATEAGE